MVARRSVCHRASALLCCLGCNRVVNRNVSCLLAANLSRTRSVLCLPWSASACVRSGMSASARSLGWFGTAHRRCTWPSRFAMLHAGRCDDGRCRVAVGLAICFANGDARFCSGTHRATRKRRLGAAVGCADRCSSGGPKRSGRHWRRTIACPRWLLRTLGMIVWKTSLRRLTLVAIALACAYPMLRPAISSALVTRGDALLYARDSRAKIKYRLALQIDPGNVIAADRYVFAAFLERTSVALEDGVQVADLVLRDNPEATAVRMDRALCLQRLRKYTSAERDFERVGEERLDVQALVLAASDAARSWDSAKARRLLRLAERIDPRYAPVRVALTRVR